MYLIHIFKSLVLILLSILLSFKMYAQDNRSMNNSEINIILYKQLLNLVTPDGLSNSREANLDLRIDPRLLNKDPDIHQIKPENLYVQSEIDSVNIVNLITEFGAKPSDIIKDVECLFSNGLPPPPQSNKSCEQIKNNFHCENIGDFVTIIFGLPRAGGAYFPASELGYSESIALDIDERYLGKEMNWYTIRAIEITSYSFAVYDLVFEKENNRWHFVNKFKLFSIMS